MANGFGYPRYPQRPAPAAQEVGSRLAAMRMQPEAQPMAGMPPPGGQSAGFAEPDEAPDYFAQETERVQFLDAGLRDDAMQRAQGGEQSSARAQSPEGDPAMAHAIGEALTRMGGGAMPSMNTIDKARRLRDVQRLGLSETEAALLGLAGGL